MYNVVFLPSKTFSGFWSNDIDIHNFVHSYPFDAENDLIIKEWKQIEFILTFLG